MFPNLIHKDIINVCVIDNSDIICVYLPECRRQNKLKRSKCRPPNSTRLALSSDYFSTLFSLNQWSEDAKYILLIC